MGDGNSISTCEHASESIVTGFGEGEMSVVPSAPTHTQHEEERGSQPGAFSLTHP